MASKVAESLAPVAVATLVPSEIDHEKRNETISASGTLSESEERDVEEYQDGLLHQVITQDGKEIVVSWSKEEEAKVVRKADFLFLPLFTVRISQSKLSRTLRG